MSSRLRFFLPLAALWLVPSVRANDLAYVKCAANDDRVWVYESLSSFDVETKLRCGAPVEILSHVKGFVKIRTESGVEGYVPEGTFPDLAPPPDATKQPLGSIAAHPMATHKMISPEPESAENPALNKPQALVAGSAKAAPAAAAIQQAALTAGTPAPARPSELSAAAPAKQPAQPASANNSAKVSPASTRAKSAAATAKKTDVTASDPPARVVAPAVSAPAAPVAPAPQRPVVETVSASARDSATMVPATATPDRTSEEDSEEYPDTKPQNESGDPACRVFFAAYGLAPSQYKWMAENRRKQFSGICPSPDTAHVDYVVLFTHDSDSYNYAMPVAVHTDHNGFSDFSPLMTADTALVPSSELEKARYEYVWVFRIRRGAFDPAKFSPRRKPQFATYAKGSRASSRAIEDAFGFVEHQGIDR